MSEYTPTIEEVLDGYVTMRGREIPGDRVLASIQALSEAERWLAAHDAEKRAEWEAEQEIDDEPCKAVFWSWDIFRHQEVDPYWMRCHRVGVHHEHENSETGATWPVEQGAER